MNSTELELLQAKVAQMSVTEFEGWLEGVKDAAYEEGHDSDSSYDSGWDDGYASAREEFED